VEHATASRLRLFSGWVSNGAVTIPGIERKASMSMDENDVGPAFAAATGMHVLAGRDLTWGDIEGHRPVALMSESAARYFFGDTNVVGRRYAKGETFDANDAYEIVGVVSDAKYSQVRGSFPRTAYVPFTAMHSELHDLYFEIRTAADPIAIASSVRGAVQQIDATLAVVQMDSMANQVSESLWQERLFARLTSAFSALALALACIGLYGTISYGVGRRRAEIALRMALGAQRTQVQWLVLRRALGLAAVGVVIGLPLALWGGTLISSMLFGLTPRDPATLTAAAVSLVLVASLAGYLPARRASLVDPARALKQE
jgi:predicted permease